MRIALLAMLVVGPLCAGCGDTPPPLDPTTAPVPTAADTDAAAPQPPATDPTKK